MKKLLLGLGSMAAVVIPVVAVVSCADDETEKVKPPAMTGAEMMIDTHKLGVEETIGALVAADIVSHVVSHNVVYTVVSLNKHVKKDFNIPMGSTATQVQSIIDEMKSFALSVTFDLTSASDDKDGGAHTIFAFIKHHASSHYNQMNTVTPGMKITFKMEGGTMIMHTITKAESDAFKLLAIIPAGKQWPDRKAIVEKLLNIMSAHQNVVDAIKAKLPWFHDPSKFVIASLTTAKGMTMKNAIMATDIFDSVTSVYLGKLAGNAYSPMTTDGAWEYYVEGMKDGKEIVLKEIHDVTNTANPITQLIMKDEEDVPVGDSLYNSFDAVIHALSTNDEIHAPATSKMMIDTHKLGVEETIGALVAADIVSHVVSHNVVYTVVSLNKHVKKDFNIPMGSTATQVQSIIDEMKSFALSVTFDLTSASDDKDGGAHTIFAFIKHHASSHYNQMNTVTPGMKITFKMEGGTMIMHTITKAESDAFKLLAIIPAGKQWPDRKAIVEKLLNIMSAHQNVVDAIKAKLPWFHDPSKFVIASLTTAKGMTMKNAIMATDIFDSVTSVYLGKLAGNAYSPMTTDGAWEYYVEGMKDGKEIVLKEIHDVTNTANPITQLIMKDEEDVPVGDSLYNSFDAVIHALSVNDEIHTPTTSPATSR